MIGNEKKLKHKISITMPGLINKGRQNALPLSVSEITSCVRGYTLALTASMTYNNFEDHPIEGIFIYPLEECSTVVGFEAMISSQIITVQIKDKSKMDDCYFDCCTTANGALQSGSGHIVLDEDLERTVLVVNLGVIPPLETVNVLVSTSSELPTLPDGGIRVKSPSVCTPRVQRTINEEQGLSPNFQNRTRDRHNCALGPHEQTPITPQLCMGLLLEEEAINSIDYEFSFQLEIRAPYLLAGVESPSHAIRADADPLARSATSVVITLADKYTYDCPVEILIYPSDPHLPHVLIEDGDMTLGEYDDHLAGKSDFIKATKKDSSNEKKVDIIRKRLHKDILHNPVVMLNFCPDLKSMTSDLRKVHGEFIFLIDRSGSMSGVNISRVKDAMVVILKSLVPASLFNIIGFGSTFKTLFTTSQSYDEETVTMACEYIRKIRADMGGTNILAPLKWILRQPMHAGHPRMLFLLTDGAVNNTGKVIELVRSHARYTRCFTFGIGQSACRRLVTGLAAVSKGTAEFLAEGERLQPKIIKSLKKTMAPVLSDIAIDWLFPDTKEVLLSPVGSTFLFPGDCLIGYSVVCDTTRYHPNPKSDKRRRYSMMHSNESASSVFYHSQEEDPGTTTGFSDGQGTHRDIHSGPPFDSYLDSMSESSPGPREQNAMGMDSKMSPRRRLFSTNQIVDPNMKKTYTPSDPSSVEGKNPLRRAKVQELNGQTSPDYGAQWKNDYHPQLVSLCATSAMASRGCPANGASHRPSSHQEGAPQGADPEHAPGGAWSTGGEDGSSSTDPSVGSLGDADCYPNQLCEIETPQEPPATPDLNTTPASQEVVKGDCKAVVSGLLCGKPVKWEVTFDINPYLKGREREEKVHEELWNETFHHLAGRSIIQDFEHMADKECEIEHGSGRRYQLYAIHTSKACNILSKYTAFVPVDLDTNEYLQTSIDYINPGEGLKRGSHSSSRSGSRKNRGYSIGLGRSQSGCMSQEAEDEHLPASVEDGVSPCSTPSSSGWERCSFTDAPQRSPSVTSDQSQKLVESLFSARLTLSRTRLLTRAAKGFMFRSHSKTSNSVGESENEKKDYIPLVSLQLACGAFCLDSALCEAINVHMDKLKWTSPFTSHRVSLSHHVSHSASRCSDSSAADHSHRSTSPSPFESSANVTETSLAGHHQAVSSYSQAGHSSSHLARSLWTEGGSGSSLFFLGGPSTPTTYAEPPLSPHSLTDSRRDSESESVETPPAAPPGGLGSGKRLDTEGMVWATAVALAWLEHSSASYFIEWELIAAKASMWLNAQSIPEGKDLASVKSAANQLFIILRHWDENLQLNMLCYNPNSV
ncbi:von Willebrand factor A domain-containing protein 5B1-like [Coregonus clupeaformis]|uniref:von Willebrand factor A domain-containing protein 5B1-like n=1 Tax=Coregonus clupeaformis TaxID=59861 RepID=UPI001BE0343A|nr:von Willebrand factor A domain-containing protein 5B1-like [Coregonus clupeaformis]